MENSKDDNYSEVEIWHPIDGKWVHICQYTKNNIRQYFTNGKLITTRETNEDGTIKNL